MKTGIVIKSTGSWYSVLFDEEKVLECNIRGKFRLKGIRLTNPVSVGDVVDVDISKNGNVINNIHKRRNYIIRKSVNLSKEAHIIASNVDLAMLIVTIRHPRTPTIFMDRFLVMAEAYGIPAVLVFNKVDLYDEDDRAISGGLKIIYERIGYKCVEASAVTGEGTENVKALLKDKMTVLSGMSGVGKSTLVNYIEPGLNLKTNIISTSHDSGKHTTTFAEMYNLKAGGYIIDTPGLRSYGIIGIEREEISHYFPEIFAESKNCRFNNCTHTHEPGCAVIEAVNDDRISETRYISYLNIVNEVNDKYRK